MADLLVERLLPRDLDAEKAALGAVLVDAAAWPRLAVVVEAADFYRDAHARVFRALARLAEAGVPPDFVLLQAELAKSGDLEAVGGPAYLAALVDGVPRAVNVEHYGAVVREKARLRSLVHAGDSLVSRAYDADTSADELAELTLKSLFAVVVPAGASAVTAEQAALGYTAGLDGDTASDAMPTGFADLDEVLSGGLRAEDLTVIAGRPSSGKTSLGLGLALALARHVAPAVFFSLEMRSRALASRLVSWLSGVPHDRMEARILSEAHHVRIGQAVAQLGGLPLYLQDSAATLAEVAAWTQRLRAEHGVRTVVLDYLQLLVPARSGQSREADVAGLSRGLKLLARREQVAVVALSALNRGSEHRRDNRPQLADLRESGAIESDADVAILLHRPEQYGQTEENHGVAEAIVAKNRQGATGVVRLAFLAELGGLFENLAQGGAGHV